jgi:hypothetical protein
MGADVTSWSHTELNMLGMGIFLRNEEREGGLSYIQLHIVVTSTVGYAPMIYLGDKLFIH